MLLLWLPKGNWAGVPKRSLYRCKSRLITWDSPLTWDSPQIWDSPFQKKQLFSPGQYKPCTGPGLACFGVNDLEYLFTPATIVWEASRILRLMSHQGWVIRRRVNDLEYLFTPATIVWEASRILRLMSHQGWVINTHTTQAGRSTHCGQVLPAFSNFHFLPLTRKPCVQSSWNRKLTNFDFWIFFDENFFFEIFFLVIFLKISDFLHSFCSNMSYY